MPHDWRDTLRLAGDLALLGILVTLGSLPVVTAGAAVGAGSAAIGHLLEIGRWPTAAELAQLFRQRLVRGLWVGPAVLLAAGLVVLEVSALRRGVVPGGAPMTAVVLIAVAVLAGYLGLRLVGAAGRRPAAVAAAAGILLLAAVLTMLVHPVLVPVLAGFVLFALHVVGRRMGSLVGV